MYTDMHKDEEGARPPPTEWHWHPSTIGPEVPLTYMPDAVLVDTQVYISGMPCVSKDIEDKGSLVYNAFGTDKEEWPLKDTLESHGPNNGSYVHDLTWMLVGWLHKEEPQGFPEWYDPAAKIIVFRDKTTGIVTPCTHQPIFGSFLSAWRKFELDSLTGELGSKILAQQEYSAMRRRVILAEAGAS